MKNTTLDVTIRRATRTDIRLLRRLDKAIFPVADLFSVELWHQTVSFIVYVGARPVGAIGLWPNTLMTASGKEEERPGCLHIVSTGLLPEWQGKGLGTLMKVHELAYARINGLTHISTCWRMSNIASRTLNKKFGFRVVGKVPGFYKGPMESAQVAHLKI